MLAEAFGKWMVGDTLGDIWDIGGNAGRRLIKPIGGPGTLGGGSSSKCILEEGTKSLLEIGLFISYLGEGTEFE